MANYKGHIIGGFAASAAYTAALSYTPVERYAERANLLHNWQALAAVFVIGMLFGLFPDVDTNSKAQDIFFWVVFPFDILLLASGNVQAAAYLGLIAMSPILGNHRGWTHKTWAMFIVPLPILLIPYLYNHQALPISAVYYGAAVAGYFSHLLLDGLILKRIHVKG